MLVRYYAAAMEAAGISEEEVASRPGITVTQVRDTLVQRHPELGPVVTQCSLLADGRNVQDPDEDLSAVQCLDVLPPFAGG